MPDVLFKHLTGKRSLHGGSGQVGMGFVHSQVSIEIYTSTYVILILLWHHHPMHNLHLRNAGTRIVVLNTICKTTLLETRHQKLGPGIKTI